MSANSPLIVFSSIAFKLHYVWTFWDDFGWLPYSTLLFSPSFLRLLVLRRHKAVIYHTLKQLTWRFRHVLPLANMRLSLSFKNMLCWTILRLYNTDLLVGNRTPYSHLLPPYYTFPADFDQYWELDACTAYSICNLKRSQKLNYHPIFSENCDLLHLFTSSLPAPSELWNER